MRTVEFHRMLDEENALRVRDFNEGLTVAMFDLVNNWIDYRRRYEEWLRK